MAEPLADRRRRIRRTVTAGTAALLAGAWGVVAVAGKGADTSSAASPVAGGDDATSVAPGTGSDPYGQDSGYGGSYGQDQGAQQTAPPISSGQS